YFGGLANAVCKIPALMDDFVNRLTILAARAGDGADVPKIKVDRGHFVQLALNDARIVQVENG
ncbi:MAG: hypothetical protein WBD83_05215, partial [Xanthobacteraceae bacterium]